MDLIIIGLFLSSYFLLLIISFNLGYRMNKKEPIFIKKEEKKREEIKLDEATITMLENIDNYDGTSNNQKDVPEEV